MAIGEPEHLTGSSSRERNVVPIKGFENPANPAHTIAYPDRQSLDRIRSPTIRSLGTTDGDKLDCFGKLNPFSTTTRSLFDDHQHD